MRKRRKWEHCLLVWTFHTHFHSRISCSIKLVLASQAEGVSPNGRHWVLHNRREDGNAGLQQWTKLSKLRARYITCVLSGAVKGHGVNYLVTVSAIAGARFICGNSCLLCLFLSYLTIPLYLSVYSIYLPIYYYHYHNHMLTILYSLLPSVPCSCLTHSLPKFLPLPLSRFVFEYITIYSTASISLKPFAYLSPSH